MCLARDLSTAHLRGTAARLRESRLLTCLSTTQGCFGMLLQHGGQTAATGNPVGEARVAFRARPGFEAGAGLRWLQVGKGQSYSSSPIRSARLSWTPATPLPVIPAAPSKSRGAPAWSGSTGGLSAARAKPPLFSLHGRSSPWDMLPRAAVCPWGCAGAGETPVGFKSCPFG